MPGEAKQIVLLLQLFPRASARPFRGRLCFSSIPTSPSVPQPLQSPPGQNSNRVVRKQKRSHFCSRLIASRQKKKGSQDNRWTQCRHLILTDSFFNRTRNDIYSITLNVKVPVFFFFFFFFNEISMTLKNVLFGRGPGVILHFCPFREWQSHTHKWTLGKAVMSGFGHRTRRNWLPWEESTHDLDLS